MFKRQYDASKDASAEDVFELARNPENFWEEGNKVFYYRKNLNDKYYKVLLFEKEGIYLNAKELRYVTHMPNKKKGFIKDTPAANSTAGENFQSNPVEKAFPEATNILDQSSEKNNSVLQSIISYDKLL
ncbi:MAG TPA: hypothetical protein DD381_07035 [Lentisphaeria bacterium]|nr:MAG: hypothetical protein A2X47_10870 [Lentisphaerae bacterium GWF2_38_69]HBM16078.1 hypothetical protein [Lentisphaeria bacterium]